MKKANNSMESATTGDEMGISQLAVIAITTFEPVINMRDIASVALRA